MNTYKIYHEAYGEDCIDASGYFIKNDIVCFYDREGEDGHIILMLSIKDLHYIELVEGA